MKYIFNISSNFNAKFHISVALTRLNEMGDILVTDIFQTADRAGSGDDYFSCCVLLTCHSNRTDMIDKTKHIESLLLRKHGSQKITIDIDLIAFLATDKAHEDWQILQKRLPLTEDVCWGLADLDINLPEANIKTTPTLANWQF